MNIKKIWVLALSLTIPGLADERSRDAKIEELLKLSNAEQLMQQQLESMDVMVAEQLRQLNLPPEAQEPAQNVATETAAVLRRNMSWDRIKPMFVRVYAETFTEEELDGIIQFYRTPAGKALLAKMPLLMSKTMAMTSELVGSSLGDLKGKIEEIMEKHKTAAPPKPNR